jgi:hypothetical protein
MISRHASRYPDSAEISEMLNILPKIRDSMLQTNTASKKIN